MAFTASYDRITKIISAVVCLFLLGIIVATHSVVVSTLGICVVLVSFAYSPRGYNLADRTISVQRLAGQALIPLDDIREARPATPEDSRGCIRLWGSGGFFGYFGLFRSRKLGKFTAYLTNRNNHVVVITGSKTVLLSPDDVDGFLAAIRASSPVHLSPPAPTLPFDAPRRSGALLTTAGFALGLAVIGVIVAANSYSPGPPSYTLTPAALTIHDRFYPVTLNQDSVDVSQIRIVDLTAEPGWRPTRRTNGFANSHYQSGWYLVSSGRKIRLYQSGGPRLVLLPPRGDGSPVLYQAQDPERFLDDIRTEWSASARSK